MKKDWLAISGMHDGASPQIFKFAAILRNTMTPAEIKLWEELKSKQLGVKFRRQHPIKTFILDFYCHEAKLSIELDGKHHLEEEQMEKDLNKTQYLQSVGILEIRFTNKEVFTNTNLVIGKIKKQLQNI